jgi:cobalt-zinc-cadmium resistance protein CzcA
LQGIEGKMFKPMAQTVAFALLGAFVLSLTYIPMMSALFLSKKTKHKPNISDKLMYVVERAYQKALGKIVRFPKLILSSVILLFISAIIVLSSLGGEFIPALEEGDFAVETRVLNGSNLNTTIENTQKAAHILKTQFPEVEKVVTKIGSGEVPTDPMPMEAADMMVILKDKSEWTSAKTFNELAEKMGKAVADIPGITTSFQFPVQMRFNELMTGAKQDVVCKIFGENLDTLAAYSQKLGAIVNTVEGAKNLYLEPVTGMPEVIIEYNRDAIAQYNLNIAEINKVVNTAFAGQSSGLLFEGEKRFDVVVRLNTDKRNDLDDVKNLLIPTPLGTQIPLYQLAKVEIKNGPNQIQREDAKRRIIIGFNVRGRDVQSIVNELQKKVEATIKFPSGYYITYGGAFENLNAAKQCLMIAVPVSLILIFLLLFFAFNSVRHSLLIYSAIPLSAIGGIFFLALRGMPFSISAGVGFIALFGVAVLNGIVLIAEFNRLKKEGYKSLHRIVLMGTKVRLRPVLMTAFVASLGFLPMALSNGAGAEVQRPLATVVIGGLMIATFLTLFVLPILYIVFEKGVKIKSGAVALLIAMLFLITNQSNAQTAINIQSAIDTALKNNLTIKNEKLRSQYQQKLIKTSASIPQTNVSGEYGQINSYYTDNRIGISQSFNFPTVYSNQKKLLTEEWKTSVLNISLKEADTKKMVRQVFYTYLYLKEKEDLLLKNDSIYAKFLERANLRFSTGESNVLEKTTAESQRGNITMQLIELQQDIELILLQFKLVLNTSTSFIPTESSSKLNLEVSTDKSLLNQHPSLKIIEQQKKTSLINQKLEKSRLMPDLNFGYYNMTMKGTGSDNVTYNSNTRFQSLQFGLGIPLFFGAQKAKINSSKINQTISENNYLQEMNLLQSQFNAAIRQYQSNLATVNYFENTALKNASLISETANKQFNNGELNYLEWVMLTNQAISIRSNYLDAVKNLNETTIQINYLISK